MTRKRLPVGPSDRLIYPVDLLVVEDGQKSGDWQSPASSPSAEARPLGKLCAVPCRRQHMVSRVLRRGGTGVVWQNAQACADWHIGQHDGRARAARNDAVLLVRLH